jgi:hypothetical protein
VNMMFAQAKFEREVSLLQAAITGDPEFGERGSNQWAPRDRPKKMAGLIRRHLASSVLFGQRPRQPACEIQVGYRRCTWRAWKQPPWGYAFVANANARSLAASDTCVRSKEPKPPGLVCSIR